MELRDKKTKTEYFEILHRYLSTVTDAKDDQQLSREFIESAQIGGFKMPTIAEKWFQNGKLEGKTHEAFVWLEDIYRYIAKDSSKKIGKVIYFIDFHHSSLPKGSGDAASPLMSRKEGRTAIRSY